MTKWKTAFLATMIATSSSTFAQAEALQGTPQEQAACRPDVRKFCQAIKPNAGNGAFLSCLLKHRDRLSDACLTVLHNHNIIQ